MIPETSDFYASLMRIEGLLRAINAKLDDRREIAEQTESLKQTTSGMEDFVKTMQKESEE